MLKRIGFLVLVLFGTSVSMAADQASAAAAGDNADQAKVDCYAARDVLNAEPFKSVADVNLVMTAIAARQIASYNTEYTGDEITEINGLAQELADDNSSFDPNLTGNYNAAITLRTAGEQALYYGDMRYASSSWNDAENAYISSVANFSGAWVIYDAMFDAKQRTVTNYNKLVAFRDRP